MRVVITRPEEKIEIEGDGQEVLKTLEFLEPKQEIRLITNSENKTNFIGNPNRSSGAKRIKPDKAAQFLKDNSDGVIAAFSKINGPEAEICVLTKSYLGTGRYIFLNLSKCLSKGNAYMPDSELLDITIKSMLDNFEVLSFKKHKDFVEYCIKYLE